MANVRTQKITESFIAIDKPIRLDETSRTRRLFVPSFSVDGEGKRHLRGEFVRQKKGKSGWEDDDGVSLKDVASGEAIKFELSSEAMARFIDGISVLLTMARLPSIEKRSERFSVAPSKQVIEIGDESLKPAIEALITKSHSRQFWSLLAELRPEDAERFADEQIGRRRRQAIDEFDRALEGNDWTEPRWGQFFDLNSWIFGLGLRYQFLHQLQDQAHYGGGDLTGKGEQKGDYLHYTEGEARFVVLVEIKRPDSPIFQTESAENQYGNGVPGFHAEFANAISQVQVNTRTWEIEGSQSEANRNLLDRESIFTVHPRSLLIYGNTQQLNTREKRVAFELFRGQLKHTEIVTYDELHRRAKFIVGELSDDAT